MAPSSPKMGACLRSRASRRSRSLSQWVISSKVSWRIRAETARSTLSAARRQMPPRGLPKKPATWVRGTLPPATATRAKRKIVRGLASSRSPSLQHDHELSWDRLPVRRINAAAHDKPGSTRHACRATRGSEEYEPDGLRTDGAKGAPIPAPGNSDGTSEDQQWQHPAEHEVRIQYQTRHAGHGPKSQARDHQQQQRRQPEASPELCDDHDDHQQRGPQRHGIDHGVGFFQSVRRPRSVAVVSGVSLLILLPCGVTAHPSRGP